MTSRRTMTASPFRRLTVLVAALLLCLAGCARGDRLELDGGPASVPPETNADGCGSTSWHAGESKTVSLTSGGRERTYLISVPRGYSSHRRAPVIMAFHGRGADSATMQSMSGFSSLPVIAVYPLGLQGTQGTAWQGAGYAAVADDVRFTGEVLNRVESELCVDRDAVYAAGMSNGGGFTNLLSCRMRGRFAAFASVSGAYYKGVRNGCSDAPPAPIMEFHGTEDTVMSYRGGTGRGGPYYSVPQMLRGWVERNGCRERPEISEPAEGVRRQVYRQGCRNGSEVQHFAVDSGGHAWFGDAGSDRSSAHSIRATEMIWEFFHSHRRYHPAEGK